MAVETIPPDVVALINNLRRRCYELERRLAVGSSADAQASDFVCVAGVGTFYQPWLGSDPEWQGSIAVELNGQTAYAPLFGVGGG